ncbi:hsp70-hsp90 organizing protein 3, partial [Phtheirospermum japonicum]
SPTNYVLYAGRSAAYIALQKLSEAISDAQITVQLKPRWSKGYYLLGEALVGLNSYRSQVSPTRRLLWPGAPGSGPGQKRAR